MTAEQYNACTCWLNQTPFRAALFRALFRILPVLSAVCYLLTLLFLFLTQHEKWLRFLLIPALVFVLVTILRKLLNIQRPYDRMNYTPFLPAKPGKGKSFPSRHTASAGAIACAFWYLYPPAGIFFWCITLLIAACRVVGGVHTLWDVAAGLFFPLIFSLLYLI